MRMVAYHPFAAKNGLTDNVNYFNSFNYTVYAPDNEAMQKAYELGLPKWSDIKAIYEPVRERFELEKAENNVSDEIMALRRKALAMVEVINNFIRYHFQDNSIYADNVIATGEYSTACYDTRKVRQKLTVKGGKGQLYVTDNSGNTITIDANSPTHYVNVMTRDYELNKRSHVISNSSFAVVHQISSPLNYHTTGTYEPDETDIEAGAARFDGLWTGSDAEARLNDYYRKFQDYYYNRYDYDIEH